MFTIPQPTISARRMALDTSAPHCIMLQRTKLVQDLHRAREPYPHGNINPGPLVVFPSEWLFLNGSRTDEKNFY
jgi:hypothetical protein